MTPSRLALAATLLLAAALRFTALGSGLRHLPHLDEQYFVENVRGMLVRGDLDHRFHEYPGLLFYILLPFVALVDRATLAREGYLVARGVVAAFGVASVGLVYGLGRAMAGPAAGLAAALVLAVSPVEVQTAHTVRPDVVLEAFVLLAFLAFTRVGERARGDWLSGAAIGAATAVKFSGVLLGPSYLIRRLLAPGPRLSRLCAAGAAALAVYAVCSPYTFLDFGSFLAGVRTQVGYHYHERPRGPQDFIGMAATYGLVLRKALGWPAALLVLAGVGLAVREWRRWLPLFVFPLATVAVFSTAEVHHDRFLVPSLGVLLVFAGLAVEWLRRRRRALAMGVALLSVVLPLAASVAYLRAIARPGTRDQAVDWVERSVPEGARVLTTLPELGLDRARYEVLTADGFDPRARLLAPHVDLVVTTSPREGLRTRETITPADPNAGPPVVLAEAAEGVRPRLQPVPVETGWLGASENTGALAAVLDGDLETGWETAGPQSPGAWIEVRFPRPARLARIELALGRRPRQFAANLHVQVMAEGGQWSRVRVVDGRPPVEQQIDRKGGASQVLLLEPAPVRGLRLVQMGQRVRPWWMAELRLAEEVGAAGR